MHEAYDVERNCTVWWWISKCSTTCWVDFKQLVVHLECVWLSCAGTDWHSPKGQFRPVSEMCSQKWTLGNFWETTSGEASHSSTFFLRNVVTGISGKHQVFKKFVTVSLQNACPMLEKCTECQRSMPSLWEVKFSDRSPTDDTLSWETTGTVHPLQMCE